MIRMQDDDDDVHIQPSTKASLRDGQVLTSSDGTLRFDLPASHVTLFLIFICRGSDPNLSGTPSSVRWRRADGANNNASPTRSLKIRWKSSSESFCSVPKDMCRRRTLNHSGLVKRWIIVIEQRSISRGDIVGSWLEMITRAPKWRCWRMIERRDSVSALEAGVSVMYCFSLGLCSERHAALHGVGIDGKTHLVCFINGNDFASR